MSRLSTRQWRKEDFPGLVDAEPRFEEFLAVLNQQSKQVEAILNGGVGYENLNRGVVTLEIAKSQVYPLKFRSPVAGKPLGLVVLRAVKTTTVRDGEPIAVAFAVDWDLNADQMRIRGLPGLSAADSYRLTLEVVGA